MSGSGPARLLLHLRLVVDGIVGRNVVGKKRVGFVGFVVVEKICYIAFIVVELKVGLHCEECIKKILKTVKKFEDIEAYDIDTKLNKVTVTGNVTNEEVIRALHKIGKQAINWEKD
ncbi:heavy metal transport/detoxification superfamily protein [Tanacetum coccineum]